MWNQSCHIFMPRIWYVFMSVHTKSLPGIGTVRYYFDWPGNLKIPRLVSRLDGNLSSLSLDFVSSINQLLFRSAVCWKTSWAGKRLTAILISLFILIKVLQLSIWLSLRNLSVWWEYSNTGKLWELDYWLMGRFRCEWK